MDMLSKWSFKYLLYLKVFFKFLIESQRSKDYSDIKLERANKKA